MIVEIIVGLVGSAIYSGIQATASGLAQKLSKPEEKELRHVYQKAFTATFEPLFNQMTDDVLQKHIGTFLKEFVSDPDVSSQFIRLALDGAEPDRRIMVNWFEKRAYNLKDFPIVSKLLVDSLVDNLAVALEESASNHESALYNRVSIALLKQIRYELAMSKVDEANDEATLWKGDAHQSPRIFISYARSDGSKFAKDLRRRLIRIFGEKAIWRDRDEMEGGVGWWNQIKEAIESVEFMVLVATPNAMQSDVVAKEWRTARQNGVCVYPVQVPDLPIDFNSLPRWMSDSHFYNLDVEWETFTNYLKHPCEALRVPFMAETPPPHFVNRPQLMDELLGRLLDKSHQNPIAITTALKGSGGFGKTTLAQALCANENVQTAFDDGVLWVTLGENPDVLLALRKVYKALTGKDGIFSDTEEGGRLLGEALEDKDCLMVIDDVWNIAHLRPFLQGGERCARIITTRDVDIAIKAKAKTTEVDEMRPDEARALLRSGIDGLADSDLNKLATRLGKWALMLEIANGMMLTRQLSTDGTWADAFTYVNRLLDRRGVMSIQTDNAEKRKQGADVVLTASLDLLNDADKTRLCALGIFKDDQDVRVSSVMALWGMDDLDSEELLTKFARLSLIKYRSSTASIRLHDVVREYFLTKLPSIPATHDQLLCGYGDPYILPDVYAWHFYAYHLNGAGRLVELRPLLLSYRWLERKLSHTDPNALIEDCDLWLKQGRDEPIRLIQSAVSNSAHVLEKDKSALAHQLAGRLMHHYKEMNEIKVFWDSIIPPKNSLFPMRSDYDPLNPAGGMMLRTMKHDSAVNGAIQLHDGRILSWSDDKTLRLWAEDGTPLAVLAGHSREVTGAVVLGDGRILSWSDDKTLRLWAEDGTPLAVLAGREDSVLAQLREGNVLGVIQLRDGRLLSWAGSIFIKDMTLRLWAEDGTLLVILEGHTNKVSGAVELGDGRLLSWSRDNTLRLWAGDGTPLAILAGHTNEVNGAMALDDGRLLSWSEDNTLWLWARDGTPLMVLSGHTKAVNGVVVLDDGRLLSWSRDKTLRLWAGNGTPLAVLSRHITGVRGAVVLGDGRLLSWSEDENLQLWAGDGTHLAVLAGHTDSVRGVVELGDGRLLTWSADKTLRLWAGDGTHLVVLAGHTDSVRGAMELGDGRLLSWSEDKTLRLWAGDGTPVVVLAGHTDTDELRGMVAVGDGWLLSWSGGVFGNNPKIRLWRTDGALIDQLVQHYNFGDRRTIASWAQGHGLTLADIYPSEKERTPLIVGGRVQNYGTDLIITNPQTGATITIFYGDAPFWYVDVLDGGRVVVSGDSVGRVLFLRWVGEDGS